MYKNLYYVYQRGIEHLPFSYHVFLQPLQALPSRLERIEIFAEREAGEPLSDICMWLTVEL